SSDLLCALLRDAQFFPRRLLCLLDEGSEDDDPPPRSSDIDRPADSIAPCQTHFPQLVLKMLHIWLADFLQSMLADQHNDPREFRPHVGGQIVDFGLGGCVDEQNGPAHPAVLRIAYIVYIVYAI